MKYRKLGNSNLEVSVIGQGTWPMGGDAFGAVDKQASIKAIQAAVDSGITLIDTAPAYGLDNDAEKLVGEALQGIRDKVVISDKCGIVRKYGEYIRCLSPTVVRGQLEDSLRYLKTDYIDIYMIHWPDLNFGIDDALELLARFKEEGKIREAAVSNFSTEQIAKAAEKAGIVCVQPPLSILDRETITSGILSYCAENGIGTMTYGALGGGVLTGKMDVSKCPFYVYEPERVERILKVMGEIAEAHSAEVSEVAVNWVLAQKGVTTALFGSTSPEHVRDIAKAADWEMTPEEAARIDAAYAG